MDLTQLPEEPTSISVIEDVEAFIVNNLQLAEFEIKHHFAGGVYEREMFIPKGFVATGKIHLTEHLAKLVTGTLRIWSDKIFGVYTGPLTFVSHPGTKRLVYAETDVVFSTFHYVGNIEFNDVKELEKYFVVDTYQQYLEFTGEQKCLGEAY